ncbi:restriction endonuclease subunit S [Neisseria sp. DTU_2020_1000833_1_SI_GRL_NUU_006]|nr:restriction endonuclease subunit S [Neisseria sp. DTU_2020_1000833_1_SI_GRL_NUU_006]
MEGLEVREVQLSRILENKDGRFDTDFWIKEPILNPQLTYRRIGECLKVSQYGISIEMNEEGIGQPIYRMNEIHNMLCDFSVSKFAQVTNSEILKFKLNNRDVLFNRTNSFEWVGRTGIYYKQPNRDFIFASYLVRFVPDENIIIPEYLTAYLNSKYGIWDLKRRARQSINQTNINPEEVKEILIPILPIRFQLEIKSNFDKARDNFIESERVYQTAQNLLLEHLGLKDFKPPAQAVNIKSFADSFGTSGRLDAEFYQEKYESYLKKIQAYPNGCELIRTACKLKDANYTPKDNQTYRYIELSNIGNLGEITGASLDLGCNLPSRARRKVSKNDVIVSSIEGSLASCAIVSEQHHQALCSTGFYVVSSEKINSETLLILFKSEPIQQLLKQGCSGTILTAINKDEFLNIPLPLVDANIQTQIADLIRQSDRLRQESQALLEEAKRKVEQAIEG